MTDVELKNTFLVDGVSEREFKIIIQQADATSENGIYKYYGDSLKVQYNRKGNIQSIKGDPNSALVRTALRNTHEAIITNHGNAIGRAILFSPVPVTCWYRYKNELQILPLGNSSEYGPTIGHGSYPFVLEFSYPSSSNNILDSNRRQSSQRELLQILNLLLCWGVNTNFSDGVSTWVSVPEYWSWTDGEQYVDGIARYIPSMKRSAMYLQLQYSPSDSFDLTTEEFSKPEQSSIKCKIIDFKAYYYSLGVLGNEVLTLPQNIDFHLDAYFQLEENINEFNRALHWFLKSSTVWELSHSLSYLCLIQSIETLSDSKADSAQCEEEKCSNNILLSEECNQCGKSIKVGGAVSSFKQFVNKFSPGISNSDRNAIYTLRSDLAQGSKLIAFDEPNFGGFDRTTHEQRSLYDLAHRVTRTCLLNWMASQGSNNRAIDKVET